MDWPLSLPTPFPPVSGTLPPPPVVSVLWFVHFFSGANAHEGGGWKEEADGPPMEMEDRPRLSAAISPVGGVYKSRLHPPDHQDRCARRSGAAWCCAVCNKSGQSGFVYPLPAPRDAAGGRDAVHPGRVPDSLRRGPRPKPDGR